MLAQNTGHPLPQKIFEAGDIVTYSGVDSSEEEPRVERWIAGAICGTGVGYSEGRSVLDALMHEMRINGVEYNAADNPSALPGRAATVVAAAFQPPDSTAEVFEVHPQVLENFKLGNPVVLFALKLGDTEYVG